MTYSNAHLAGLTYDQAENAYHNGYITQTQWDGYAAGWRRSAPRLSSLAANMAGPQSPEVEAIAAEIAQAAGYNAARRAHGDSYADYLISHDKELAAKGRTLRPWPLSLQGNDGD